MGVNHPASGRPFDYEHICKTCPHFTDKQRTVRGTKYRDIRCALDPEQRNLAELDRNTSWSAMPACASHPLAN